MEIWDSPGKYLGLPATWGRNKTFALAWIKDRIMEKLDGWKEYLLNQAGKEVLIKSVIQAIPSYAMAIVKFPQSFCSELNSIVARFWWRGHRKERGIHWRSWSKIAKPKKEGGMGFRNFLDQNTAHLAKQAWRILSNPNTLWAKILKAIYFPNSDFSKAETARAPSWLWRSLVEGKNFLLRHGRWAIGKGDSIRVRGDSWLWNGDLIPQLSPPSDMRVNELLDPGTRGWNQAKVSLLFPPAITFRILQTPVGLTEGKDFLFGPILQRECTLLKLGITLLDWMERQAPKE